MLRGRRSLIPVFLFAVALITILYLNLGSSSSSNRKLAWKTIQYETTTTEPPKAHGICPGLFKRSKPALVVAYMSTDGDKTWLEGLSGYHLCLYQVDAERPAKQLHVPRNRGHEAMTYLTFIIDNYDAIPISGAVFVHGSRFSWHNDHREYDNLKLLTALNVSGAIYPYGYHNLRCDWTASMCDRKYAPPQGSLENQLNGKLEPWNDRTTSDAALPQAFANIFGGKLSAEQNFRLGRSQAVRSQCCAQFVVSRESIHQHSREEYVALRQWLLDDGVAPKSDKVAGRILSYLWHILFIREDDAGSEGEIDLDRCNALACPRAADCYCQLYGRCDLLKCVNPGRCPGQYAVPKDFTLPDDWAATHP